MPVEQKGSLMSQRVERKCRLFHAWESWKVLRRGPGKHYESDAEIVILERSCARCGDLQLKTVVS
ncbi:hypothetical protein LCGC14_2879800 [marine sediment metagenome]|uniref:Uncharacterized protein n=1 Tax=marine sediment metagenome TaxID=412755 RepID=A0A0F8Y0M5_9ZZZZ